MDFYQTDNKSHRNICVVLLLIMCITHTCQIFQWKVWAYEVNVWLRVSQLHPVTVAVEVLTVHGNTHIDLTYIHTHRVKISHLGHRVK